MGYDTTKNNISSQPILQLTLPLPLSHDVMNDGPSLLHLDHHVIQEPLDVDHHVIATTKAGPASHQGFSDNILRAQQE